MKKLQPKDRIGSIYLETALQVQHALGYRQALSDLAAALDDGLAAGSARKGTPETLGAALAISAVRKWIEERMAKA